MVRVEKSLDRQINQILITDDDHLSIKQSFARRVVVDKLSLSCRASGRNFLPFNDDFLSQLDSLGFKKRWVPDGRYDDSCAYSLGRVNFTLSKRPRWPNFPTYWIQLNPSYFQDFQHLTRFLSLAMPGFDPLQAKVTALDVAVDFEEPIQSFRKKLSVKGYQRLECKFSKEMTLSLYIGGKPLFRVYDKGLELGQGKGHLTRLELHTEGNQVPVKTYTSLPDLSKANLFKRIQLVELEEPRKKSTALKDFWTLYNRLGYEPAHFEFRRSRNYKRDIGKHLRVLNTETVDYIVQKGLTGFFEPVLPQLGSAAS